MTRSRRSIIACGLAAATAIGALSASTAGAQTEGGGGGEVVGGTPAAAGEFPFVVAIEGSDAPAGLDQFCGGSLISTTRVLTAAHCVDDAIPSEIAVLVGTHLLDSGGQQIAVDEIHVHRGWDPDTSRNDLAVLDLSAPVTLSTNVAPIPTPRRNQNVAPAGTLSTVVGWGRTAEAPGGSFPSYLLKAGFPILADSGCSAYGLDFHGPTMLCAGVLAGGTDACQGDSGGPLSTVSSGTTYQVGIVSWGIGCARPDFPGVYTRLSTYAANNDDFERASRVPSGGGRLAGRNYLATRQTGEPLHAAGNRGGGSAWFVWTAAWTGTVRINTFGSSLDTLLGVYRGPSMGALSRVAGNDDAGTGRQSQVQVRAAAGTTYRIAVDGYDGDIGNISLRVAYR